MRTFRTSIMSLVAAGAIGGAALAQAPAPKSNGYTFPQKIGIAELGGVEDFETKTPGLGQAGQYTFKGWRMLVYVYDKQRGDIADTPNADQIKAELDLSVGDIIEAKKLGHYVRLDEGKGFAMPPLAMPPIFQCRAFVIQAAAKPGAEATKPYETYLCVTTLRRKFIKLRISSTTPAGDPATVFTPVAAAIEMTGRVLSR